LTRLFSGRPARALRNRCTDELAAHENLTAPFPTQRALSAPLVKASLDAGKSDFAQMWSGQAGPTTRDKPSAEIFRDIVESSLALLS
jgi:nitronate monooxygenase